MSSYGGGHHYRGDDDEQISHDEALAWAVRLADMTPHQQEQHLSEVGAEEGRVQAAPVSVSAGLPAAAAPLPGISVGSVRRFGLAGLGGRTSCCWQTFMLRLGCM